MYMRDLVLEPVSVNRLKGFIHVSALVEQQGLRE